MKFAHKSISSVIALVLASNLSGCAVGQQASKMQSDTTNAINSARAQEPAPAPVVSSTSGSWLMGQSIKVVPPISPILTSPITYHPALKVSLAEVASYIRQETGLVVDVSEVQVSNNSNPQVANTFGGATGMPAPIPGPSMMPARSGATTSQLLQPMSISYEGTVSGLLDIAAGKSAIWWKFVDGEVIFYRTLTKTFYLPTNARQASGSSMISAVSGGSAGTGSTGSSGSTGSAGSSSGTGSSGATDTSNYSVDVWGDLEKTAKIVGSGAQVVANQSVGSLTVTGSPAQVRAIEEWVKGLSEQLSQQVAITIHMYRIKFTNEETYNWDPSIVFKKSLGTYGINMTPSTPLIPVSGSTPVGLGLSMLSGPAGTSWGQYSGSQAAFQALSTLGNVSETLQRTVVTLNGQPAPIQIANQQGYLASSSSTLAVGVGAITTMTPGTITTGFTATFLPRVVNGKIILNMTMTTSSLLGITTVGNSSSSIQTPNVDSDTFQQSVSLTPGDAMLLTGSQQDNSQTGNSGVGSATNAMFGGGVDNNTNRSMIAIVVSAKVL